jgi:putative SOS response-associated peptidase YedK
MCGRFRLSRQGKEIIDDFAVDGEIEWSQRYNIAPSDIVPTIRQDRHHPVCKAVPARWGLIPSWTKDASIGFKTINAVSETAASKPAFRDAMKWRRCLIPADGFYEWKALGAKQKQPYSFGMVDDSLFAFAGLWDIWRDPEGKLIESFTILTTNSNVVVSAIHDRMPAILQRDDYDLWLDPGIVVGCPIFCTSVSVSVAQRC